MKYKALFSVKLVGVDLALPLFNDRYFNIVS